MYRIVPSDTPKESEGREGGRESKAENGILHSQGGEEVGEVLSLLSSSSSPSSSHSLPLLYFSFGHSVLLGEETFYVFPSCLVFEFIRPLFCPSSVRPSVRPSNAASCGSPPKSHGHKESGSIESEQKRPRGRRAWGKGEGCLLGTKKCTDSTSSSPAEWTLEGECGEEIALTLGGGLHPRSTKNIY